MNNHKNTRTKMKKEKGKATSNMYELNTQTTKNPARTWKETTTETHTKLANHDPPFPPPLPPYPSPPDQWYISPRSAGHWQSSGFRRPRWTVEGVQKVVSVSIYMCV